MKYFTSIDLNNLTVLHVNLTDDAGGNGVTTVLDATQVLQPNAILNAANDLNAIYQANQATAASIASVITEIATIHAQFTTPQTL